SDFNLIREGSSQTVTFEIADTGERLTLKNQFKLTSTVLFGDYYYDGVEEIRFADGSVWDMEQLSRKLLLQARTDGDDTIYGFDFNDVLDGGAGNDRLEGGIYGDRYVFAAGYGHDVIFDHSAEFLLPPGRDMLDRFGINFDDIRISRAGEDLTFTLKSTGESVTLEHQYNRFDGQWNAIEEFRFADQTVLYSDLNPEDVDLVGTNGDDVLVGTHFAETIDGRGGNDTMYGSSDGDTYKFDVGYGQDVIIDRQETAQWFNADHVVFGADITTANIQFTKDGNDLLITIVDRVDTLRIRDQFLNNINGVEHFHFADGTHWTISDVEEMLLISGGGRGDDVIDGIIDAENILDGREGDDTLNGGRAGD